MLMNPALVPEANFNAALSAPGRSLPELLVIIALGNGFILTAMLWGAFLAESIDRRLRVAAFYLLLLAGLTFFGIIHSATPQGNVYLPWKLAAASRRVPYQFAVAYLALAAVIVALSFTAEARHFGERHA